MWKKENPVDNKESGVQNKVEQTWKNEEKGEKEWENDVTIKNVLSEKQRD